MGKPYTSSMPESAPDFFANTLANLPADCPTREPVRASRGRARGRHAASLRAAHRVRGDEPHPTPRARIGPSTQTRSRGLPTDRDPKRAARRAESRSPSSKETWRRDPRRRNRRRTPGSAARAERVPLSPARRSAAHSTAAQRHGSITARPRHNQTPAGRSALGAFDIASHDRVSPCGGASHRRRRRGRADGHRPASGSARSSARGSRHGSSP